MPDQNILQSLANNEALYDAVKSTVLKHFEDLPYQEGASDELLGQITRARIVGRKLVEQAFLDIAKHKTNPESKPVENPAY